MRYSVHAKPAFMKTLVLPTCVECLFTTSCMVRPSFGFEFAAKSMDRFFSSVSAMALPSSVPAMTASCEVSSLA